jgi:glutaredoxin 3
VVFAKTWCGYCNKTKDLFRKPDFQGMSIKILDLDAMPAGTPSGEAVHSVLTQTTGQSSVPNVWINGQFLGGNDVTQAKYARGELMQMLSNKA